MSWTTHTLTPKGIHHKSGISGPLAEIRNVIMTTTARCLSFGGTPKGARRNLFGSASRAENRALIEKYDQQFSNRDVQRWNFNFGNGTPLPGELSWERVEAEDVPEVYTRMGRITERACRRRTLTPLGTITFNNSSTTATITTAKQHSNMVNISTTDGASARVDGSETLENLPQTLPIAAEQCPSGDLSTRPVNVQEEQESSPSSSPQRGLKRKQTKINEYFPCKRHHASSVKRRLEL